MVRTLKVLFEHSYTRPLSKTRWSETATTPAWSCRWFSATIPALVGSCCLETTSTKLSGRFLTYRKPMAMRRICIRSEEHTSELQSLMRPSYAVFCLKKKNQRLQHH